MQVLSGYDRQAEENTMQTAKTVQCVHLVHRKTLPKASSQPILAPQTQQKGPRTPSLPATCVPPLISLLHW